MTEVIREVTFTSPQKPEFKLTVPIIGSDMTWIERHAIKVSRMMLDSENVDEISWSIKDGPSGNVKRKVT